jgi:molybdenum cofactor cytidylyltransferase
VSCAAVILAAGGSSRLGTPKQLLAGPRGPLVTATVAAARAARASHVVVTVGSHAHLVHDAVVAADAQAMVVHVPTWAEGQHASLHAALDVLHTLPADVEGAWLLVADQPLLDAPVLVALEDAWRRTGADASAAHYGEVTGVPALIGRAWWPHIASAEGGARGFLRDPARRVARVEWPDGAFDVDTPADAERLAALVAAASAR